MIVTEPVLAATLSLLESTDHIKRARETDKVQNQQPHLFEMVLIQKELGASLETMDCLLEILLVSHQAIKSTGNRIRSISDNQMIEALNRFVKEIGFASGLTADLLKQSIQQYRKNHCEPVLFRWALQRMTEAGVTDFASDQQSSVLAACTIVNCIAAASSSEEAD